MALYPDSPVEILLKRIKALLDAVDWLDLAGVTGLTVRFARNRPPRESEKPCLSIGFVDDSPEPDAAANGRNAFEAGRQLQIDLQVDMALSSEDSNLDPTGWGRLLRVVAVAFDALAVMDRDGTENGLWDHADDVRRDETGPNEDSTPDEGRLVQGLTVIYRVSATAPNRLLAPGVTYDD